MNITFKKFVVSEQNASQGPLDYVDCVRRQKKQAKRSPMYPKVGGRLFFRKTKKENILSKFESPMSFRDKIALIWIRKSIIVEENEFSSEFWVHIFFSKYLSFFKVISARPHVLRLFLLLAKLAFSWIDKKTRRKRLFE